MFQYSIDMVLEVLEVNYRCDHVVKSEYKNVLLRNSLYITESELSLWEKGSESLIINNWLESEMEKLNHPGHEMIKTLGAWFADAYSHSGVVNQCCQSPPLFRSSASGRGKESGLDFISGFNASSLKVIVALLNIAL